MSMIEQYSDDMFWKEATRRWQQRTLTPADPQRAVVMEQVNSGNVPQQQEPVQYAVVCSGCGNKTTVPFKPNSNRPIYCLECYRARQGQ